MLPVVIKMHGRLSVRSPQKLIHKIKFIIIRTVAVLMDPARNTESVLHLEIWHLLHLSSFP